VSPKGQPDLQIILMQVDGPNMKPEAAATIRGLLEQGKLNGASCNGDCRKTYESDGEGRGVCVARRTGSMVWRRS